MDDTPFPPQSLTPPPLPPQPQPQPIPLTVSPPTPIPYLDNNHPHLLLPFPPPTTPTSSSPTTTLRKKRRSKLLRIDTTAAIKKSAPSAPQITPPCTECGKTFWSWKALFGHMRCHPERQWRGINPPPQFRRRPLPETPPCTPTTTTSEDNEVAASLLLLAAGPASPDVATASTAKFECSSCKKTFGSHQALGGHRASHKNVKGCFAITKSSIDVVEDEHFMIMQTGQSQEEGIGLGLSLGLGLEMGHSCGVCLKVFPTGQALGGHMRCHWERTEDQPQQPFGLDIGSDPRPIEAQCGLDLNIPAHRSLDDHGSSSSVDSSNNMQLELRLGI